MFLKNTNDIPSFVAGDKTILKEIVHPKNDPVNINYSIAHARVPVGGASLPHTLESSEVYYILEGEGQMFIEEEDQPVKKGDIFFVPPKAKQFIRNTGTTELIFLCVVEPFWKEEEEHL